MSPEQAQGETITPQTDLFSLGCVMYAMCTGHPPFRASTTMGVLKKVCEAAPRPIRDINPEIPDWLCAIINRLLARDSTQRFATARETAELLEQWLAHVQHPLAVPRPAPLTPLPESSPTGAATSAQSAATATEVIESRRDRESSGHPDRTLPTAGSPSVLSAMTSRLVPELTDVRERLRGPAWGLMILGMTGLLLTLCFCVALVHSMGTELLGCRPSGWGMSILPIVLLLLAFGCGFAGMLVAGRRMMMLQNFSISVTGCVLAMLVPPANVIGLPIGVWGLVRLRGRELRETFAAQRKLESSAPGNPAGLALLRERLCEPAAALILTGLLNWLFLVMLVLITLQAHLRKEYAFQQLIVPQYPTLIALAVLFSVTSTLIVVAGLQMLHLRSYPLVLTGAGCAAVTLPGMIVGLPVAAWVLASLIQPEVRAAFAAASLTPSVHRRESKWEPWKDQKFWIILVCIAIGLWLAQREYLNPSGWWSAGSLRNHITTNADKSSQFPSGLTLTRPDEILPIGRSDVRRMAVSRGGALLAVAGGSRQEGSIKIWNAQTLQESALQTSPHPIHCLAFGEHGRVLVTGEEDGRIRLRDGRTGVVQQEIAAHSTPVTAVAFSEAGDGLISGGEDGTLRLWPDRGSTHIDFPGMSAAVTDIAITRDGSRIAAASRDGCVHLWTANGMPVTQLSYPAIPLRVSLDEVDGQLGAALDNGDCEVISFRGKHTIGRWTLPAGTPTELRTAYWNQSSAAVFITASDDGRIRLHDFAGFRQPVMLQSSSSALSADLIGGRDRIVSAHADGQLRIWNLNRP